MHIHKTKIDIVLVIKLERYSVLRFPQRLFVGMKKLILSATAHDLFSLDLFFISVCLKLPTAGESKPKKQDWLTGKSIALL